MVKVVERLYFNIIIQHVNYMLHVCLCDYILCLVMLWYIIERHVLLMHGTSWWYWYGTLINSTSWLYWYLGIWFGYMVLVMHALVLFLVYSWSIGTWCMVFIDMDTLLRITLGIWQHMYEIHLLLMLVLGWGIPLIILDWYILRYMVYGMIQ